MARRIPVLLGLALLMLARPFAAQDSLDVIIRGGRVIDGTGSPWYRADIGIADGRIVAIGNLSGRSAATTIAAKDRVVSPGFIDLMGGGDLPMLRDPVTGQSKLRQGITTMMSGEGGSVAPRRIDERPVPEGSPAFLGTWRTFAEYFELVRAKGLPLNVIHNVGAAQVREVVIGGQDRAPTPGQLQQMQDLVEQAMKDGAVGLSSALIYPPGAFAKTEELVALAKVAARYHGVYFTHMRNESAGLLDALAEAIHIGEEASIPVQVFHLKAAGQSNWPLMPKALQMIRDARARGVDVTADIYPYIRNGIGLGSFIHPRHYAKGEDAFLSRLSDTGLRDGLRREIQTTTDWENWYRHVGSNWDNVLITGVRNPAHAEFVGLSVQQVATTRSVPAWTAFFDLVQERGVSVAPLSMNEEQKREALRAPFVMIDCDSDPTDPATAKSAHPRAFGTMARVLAKYVREEKVISLEEAVQKMSSLAATRLGLYDRGRIALGMVADLVVFDETNVRDTATFEKPLSYSVGFDYVLVNGQVVIDDGRWTRKLAGQILRHRPARTGSKESSEEDSGLHRLR